MLLSINHAFEIEKLKKQASEVHWKLNGYLYEVLLEVRSRQDSQRYVRQVQRAQIFVQQMTTFHELSIKITNFYSKQKWASHDLKKVVDHVAKMLNDGSKREFQREIHKPETYRQRHWVFSMWGSRSVTELCFDSELGRNMWCNNSRLWKRYL